MDKQEAREALEGVIDRLRERGYEDLRLTLLGDSERFEVVGASGKRYQVETEAFWNAEEDGPLRVVALTRYYGSPPSASLSESFVVAPDGSFVDD